MVPEGSSEDWKKANVTPMFKKGKKEYLWICRLVSLTLIPGKVMEQLMLKTISRYVKDKKDDQDWSARI